LVESIGCAYNSAPTALLHSLKHYKVLHGENVVLTVIIENTPYVKTVDRVSIEPLGKSFSRVRIRFGFMETPNVPRALGIARKQGWSFDIMSTSFFLSRRSVRADPRSGMPHGRIGCSSCLLETPMMRAAISICPLTVWSRSALK
jgi:K+ transporter